MVDRRGSLPAKILSPCREQERQVSYGAVFESKKETSVSHSSESVARNPLLTQRSLPMSRVKQCLIGTMTLLVLLCGVNAMAATVEVGACSHFAQYATIQAAVTAVSAGSTQRALTLDQTIKQNQWPYAVTIDSGRGEVRPSNSETFSPRSVLLRNSRMNRVIRSRLCSTTGVSGNPS